MSNYEDVYAPDLTEETESTLSGSEQFVMFDSVEGKRAELSTIADYIVANGEIDGSDIPTIVSTIEGSIGTLDTKVGDLTDLDTTDKTDIVSAVNEVNGKADQNTSDIAELKEEINEYEGSKPFPISSNLIDPSKVSGKGEYWVNGIKYVDTGTTGNTSKMVSVQMPCKAETTYYNALYSILNDQRANNSNATYLNYFEEDGTYISWETCPLVQINNVYQGVFTTPANTGYVIITYVAYENGTDTAPYRKLLCQETPVPNTYVAYVSYDLHSAKSGIDNLGAETKIKEVITGTSSYQQNGGVIKADGTWGASPDSSSYTHLVIPCTADFTFFSVTAVATKYFYITAVTDYVRHASANDEIQNKTSYWLKTVEVGAGKTVSGLVPKDAKYLLVTSKSDGDTISSLTITKYYNADKTPYNINRCTLGAFNVRDFGDGSVEGCPAELVDEKLPLWKNLISGWLNTDFLNICEWRSKFDENNTIDSYDTLFKQFFPYMYEVVSDGVAIQCMMSKHECVFTELNYYGDVNRIVPMLITVIDGKSVAVVGWIQSATDTVANREKAYRNAATMLGTFDRVVLGGDFNTEVGLDELEELTDRGYTLGNGGYWGVINTWPAHNPATPNDNIASKGCILEMFETNENHITSDHLPVRAKFTL